LISRHQFRSSFPAVAVILTATVVVLGFVGMKQYRELATSKGNLEAATARANEMASESWADYGTYAAVVGSDGFEAVECKLTKHRKGPICRYFLTGQRRPFIQLRDN